MNKLDTKKRAFILLVTYFIILFTPKLKRKQTKIIYNSNYHITEDNQFAAYNNYNIYICNNETDIPDDTPNNIYIIDNRYEDNPNIQIHNSYKISDQKEILEILKILLEYEDKYPTKWDRTITSMKNEWLVHNIGYILGIETIRTKEVDLDNNDEENYQNILTIINTLLNNDYYQKETNSITKKLTK